MQESKTKESSLTSGPETDTCCEKCNNNLSCKPFETTFSDTGYNSDSEQIYLLEGFYHCECGHKQWYEGTFVQ